jgi:hypothetical protein
MRYPASNPVFALGLSFCFAALVTWLVSMLGIIEFSIFNSFVVWILLILLGMGTGS